MLGLDLFGVVLVDQWTHLPPLPRDRVDVRLVYVHLLLFTQVKHGQGRVERFCLAGCRRCLSSQPNWLQATVGLSESSSSQIHPRAWSLPGHRRVKGRGFPLSSDRVQAALLLRTHCLVYYADCWEGWPGITAQAVDFLLYDFLTYPFCTVKFILRYCVVSLRSATGIGLHHV